MDSSLFQYWEKYKYPYADKFYQILKKDGISVSRQEVEDFIAKQETSQLHKKKHNTVKGHIVAYEPDFIWFADLLDMQNYSRKNKGNKYILICIDVFTRKAYARTIKEIIFKDFTEKDTVVWYDKLQDYINAYNNSPHSSLENLTPNQATESDENIDKIKSINVKKSLVKMDPRFTEGVTVRKKLKKPTFTKGYKQLWGKRTYEIDKIIKTRALLKNGEYVPLNSLQVIPEGEILSENETELEREEEQAKVERKLKKEGLLGG